MFALDVTSLLCNRTHCTDVIRAASSLSMCLVFNQSYYCKKNYFVHKVSVNNLQKATNKVDVSDAGWTQASHGYKIYIQKRRCTWKKGGKKIKTGSTNTRMDSNEIQENTDRDKDRKYCPRDWLTNVTPVWKGWGMRKRQDVQHIKMTHNERPSK